MDNMESMGLDATVDRGREDAGRSGDTHVPMAPLSKTGLKEKYGKIYEITVTVDEDDENEGRRIRFLFTQPSVASFNRYVKTASKNVMNATAVFVRDNIIEEQVTDLEKQCAAYPGLALNMGQKLLNVLGLGDNINFRRL